MLRCASSLVVAAYADVRLTPRGGALRALPADFLRSRPNLKAFGTFLRDCHMLVSLKWLRDYVDVDVSPEELAELLTMAGLEVDSLEGTGPAFSEVKGAKNLFCKSHPDADNLSLCEVTTGEATYPVICGARNVSVGDTVPLAQVGATLPGGYGIRSS